MITETKIQNRSYALTKAQIIFYLSKKKTNCKGLAPIICRITASGKRAEISTGIRIKPTEWGNEKITTSSKTESINLNTQINIIKNQILQIETDIRLKGRVPTAQLIKHTFFNDMYVSPTFLNIYSIYLETKHALIGHEIKERQYLRYERLYDLLKVFIKAKYNRDDLEIEEIKPKFGLDFYHYMITVKKFNATYSAKTAGILKSVLDYAIIQEYTKHNPLKPLKFKRGKEAPVYYLSIEQIKKLIATQFESEALNLVRDIFLFQCYTGLAYADVSAFSLEHINVDANKQFWILINRQKTGTKSTIPLLPEALEIISKYKDVDKSNLLKSTHFYNKGILPVFANQVMNRLLKQIAMLINIEGNNLTTHIARKTFATTVLNTSGVSIETVSAMLGHSNINVTQKHYAQVDQRKISHEMNDFKFLTT